MQHPERPRASGQKGRTTADNNSNDNHTFDIPNEALVGKRVVGDRIVVAFTAAGSWGLGTGRWQSRPCHRLEVTFNLFMYDTQHILN